jgi:hypothetical protein
MKYRSKEELQQKIDTYFIECNQKEKPYTITGLALALDMSRQGLINYSNRDEFFDTIKKAKQMVENFNEEMLLSGKNVTGVIFNLKNNWNWQDKISQEQDQKIYINLNSLDELKNGSSKTT